jgi:hypothetical protein
MFDLLGLTEVGAKSSKDEKMSMEDHDDEDGAQGCPYCSSADECVHVLLAVDRTFRTADGGVLMNAFNERWSRLCEDGGDDFDEREPFENLLEEVDAVADFSTEYDSEGGPGMSSACAIYYVESADKAKDAMARFLNGNDQ